PEVSLFLGAYGGFGRGPRVGVARQRIVAVYEVNSIAVRLQHLVDGRVRTLAERALKIRKLDQLNRGVRRTLRWMARGLDFLARRFQRNRDRNFFLQLSDERVVRRGHPLVDEQRLDRVVHLRERGALDTRRVRLIPERDVVFRGRRGVARDFLFD